MNLSPFRLHSNSKIADRERSIIDPSPRNNGLDPPLGSKIDEKDARCECIYIRISLYPISE